MSINTQKTPSTRRSGGQRVVLATIDLHIGARLHARRRMLGMSLQTLGARLGLSYQQLQKYERGVNRIGGGTLWRLSEILDVAPSFFFDGLARAHPAAPAPARRDSRPSGDRAASSEREAMDLIRAYGAIENGAVCQRVRQLIASLARASSPRSALMGTPPAAVTTLAANKAISRV